MFRFLVGLILLAFASQPALAQRAQPNDAEIANFVDDYVGAAVRERGIPGAAVVVVRGGRPILARGYGVANYESRRPINVHTSVFRQGSTSKLFIWLLAMQLVEERRLELDRDVNDYLDFRIPDEFGAPITMRHLMTHTAGFPERFRGVLGSSGSPLGKALRDNIPPRVYRPGQTVAYSNYGAALAAYIVEQLRGRPFENLVRERIFVPLAMTSSSFEQPLPTYLKPMLVSGYGASSRSPHPFETIGLAPMGALSASPADMGRFLSMLLNGGSANGHAIVRATTLMQMLRLQQPLTAGLPDGFGYGFILRTHKGVRLASHGGTMASAATDLQLLPDRGLGWHIAMNGLGDNGSGLAIRDELARAIIDRFYAQPKPMAASPGRSTAREAVGVYLLNRRFVAGPLRVGDLNLVRVLDLADGSLKIDAVSGKEGTTLRWLPVSRDRFVDEEHGTSLALVRDGNGQVAGFAGALVNAVSGFERAPAWLAAAPLLLGVTIGLLLLEGASFGVRGIWRLVSRRSVEGRGETSPRTTLDRASRYALLFLLTNMFGWLVFMAIVMDDPYKLVSLQPAYLVLAFASIAMIAAAAIMAAAAISEWRKTETRWYSGVWSSGVALAAVGYVYLLYMFGFMYPSTSF